MVFKPSRLLPTVLTLLILPALASAEIYRWVDENGKVHYGDRKPVDADAEQMEDGLEDLNVSQAQAAPPPSDRLPETDAERTARTKAERDAEREIAKRQKQCSLVRHRLKAMSGPVYFVDEDGKEFDISEEERSKREAQLRRAVKRYCD